MPCDFLKLGAFICRAFPPQAIQAAASPEEAARLGRGAQRSAPQLVRPDWESAKLGVMRAALLAKFRQHAGPRAMLLATAASERGPQQVGTSRSYEMQLTAWPAVPWLPLAKWLNWARGIDRLSL